MKTKEPESRLGVFKSHGEIPERWRIDLRGGYESRDVWAEYEEAEELNPDNSNRSAAKSRWNRITEENGEHHALATPETVEEWATELTELSFHSIQNQFRIIFRFYRWLRWHSDHPHTYNPILLAAANYPNTRQAWTAYKDETRYKEIQE